MSKKNKKKSEQQDSAQLDFLDNRYFQWIVENRKSLGYALLGCLFFLVIGFKLMSGKTAKAEESYLTAENEATLLHRSLLEGESTKAAEYLKKLQNITTTYPEIVPRYEGLMAQAELLFFQPQAAQNIFRKMLQRQRAEGLSPYQQFSKTTLHIAEGKYTKALEEAKSLKKELLTDLSALKSRIFAYNLLRISVLEGKVGTPESEMTAWLEWEKYAKDVSNFELAQGFDSIAKILKNGSFTLENYKKAKTEIAHNELL